MKNNIVFANNESRTDLKPFVVHFIARDRFTTGYINFMQTVMTGYTHCFITTSKGFELNSVKDAQVIYIAHSMNIVFSKKICMLLRDCAMFIMSGCGTARWVAFLSKNIQEKTYFHFWGGDFYGLRMPVIHDGRLHPGRFINKTLTKNSFKNGRALVFLIEGEYEKFVEITGIENRHFVAPMPEDPFEMIMYSDYVTDEHLKSLPEGPVRVSVGHSASKECCHIDALDKLAKYRDEDIEIICPLSYGDENYGKEVTAYGRKIFGDKFIPLTQYMDKVAYIKLLSTCDVGINNSDRQHGMGNINMLMGTGAKLYMRSDTSMWEQYQDYGFSFYNIKDIENLSFKEFCEFDTELRERNIEVQDERLKSAIDANVKKWSVIFEDGVKAGQAARLSRGV